MARQPVELRGPEQRSRSRDAYYADGRLIVDDDLLEAITPYLVRGALSKSIGFITDCCDDRTDDPGLLGSHIEGFFEDLTAGRRHLRDLEAARNIVTLKRADTCDQLANMLACQVSILGEGDFVDRQIVLLAEQAIATILSADATAFSLAYLADRAGILPDPAISVMIDPYVRQAGFDVHEVARVSPLEFVAATMAYRGSLKSLLGNSIFRGDPGLQRLIDRGEEYGRQGFEACGSVFFQAVALGLPESMISTIVSSLIRGEGLDLLYS